MKTKLKKEPKILEETHQKTLFQALELYKSKHPGIKYIYHPANGRFRSIAVAKKLRAEGVKSGVPDVVIPIRGRNGEPGAYLEMKAEGGVVSEAQRDYLEFLKSQGYVTSVAYNWEEGLNFILDYLGVRKI